MDMDMIKKKRGKILPWDHLLKERRVQTVHVLKVGLGGPNAENDFLVGLNVLSRKAVFVDIVAYLDQSRNTLEQGAQNFRNRCCKGHEEGDDGARCV